MAFAEAATPEFADYQNASSRTRRRSPRRSTERGFRLVSGGTDNHLMMVDVGARGISGKDAEKLLERVGLTVQQEHDPLRHAPADGGLGHPHRHAGRDDARHGVGEMETIADAIARAIEPGDEAEDARIQRTVSELCAAFPLV